MNRPKQPNKKVAITGATGFLGRNIGQFMSQQGYEVIRIGRQQLNEGPQTVADLIDGVHLVINLAGAPVLAKWTEAHKQEIYYSRILTTRILSEALHLVKTRPELFISASAVGIYNTTDIHDEFSERYDTGFLGTVCADWEKEALSILAIGGIRLAILRLGIVLGKNGGAYPRMALPFKFFVGGKIGAGKNWVPYVHIDDLLGAIRFVINTPTAGGIYNMVAPNPTTNAQMSAQLGKALHRPCWLTVPVWPLRVLYGDGVTTVIKSHYVKPHRLVREGYHFQYPTIESALAQLVGSK